MRVKSVFVWLAVSLLFIGGVWAHPADPSSLLAQYSLYGEDSLVFTNAAITADGGWIGSDNYVKMTTYGAVTVGGKVKAGNLFVGADPQSSSSNPTQYKDTIFVDLNGSWSGDTKTAPALIDDRPVAHPVFPNFAASDITIGTDDVIISNAAGSKADTVLAPGRYRKIVADHGTFNVIMGAGLYEVDTLEVYNTLLIDKKASEFTRILVKSALIIKEHSGTHDQVIEKNGNFGRVLIHVAGTDVELGDNVRIDATIIAPNADVEARTGMRFYGQLLAKSVTVTEGFDGSAGSFEPFDPGTVIIPDSILNGVPEDTAGDPAANNSYLISFPITLADTVKDIATMKYEILSTSPVDPAATEGSDFSLDAADGATKSGTLTYAAGTTIPDSEIALWIIDDTDYEPANEHITIRLYDPVNILFSNGTDTLEFEIPIVDEDEEATVPYEETIVFPQSILDGVEEDPSNQPKVDNSYLLSFPLGLTANSAWNGSVSYQVLATAQQAPEAIDAADFLRDQNGAAATGMLTFSQGNAVSNDSIHIWIVDDSEIEPNEYITVRLFTPDSVKLPNGTSEQFFNIPIISEDDSTSTANGTMVFTQSVLDGVEEDPLNDPLADNSYLLSFPLELTTNSAWNGSISYEVLGTAQQAPEATEIADFIRNQNGAAASGTLSFSEGNAVSNDSIHIWIVDDSKIEPNEFITVRLFNPDSIKLPNGTTEQFFSFPIISEDDSTSTTTGQVDPTSTGEGALYDLDGDGDGDQVKLTITSDTRVVDDILSITWRWPATGTATTIDAASLTASGTKTVTWSVTDVEGNGEGTATVLYKDSLHIVAPLNDSVGAALVNGFADLRDETRTADAVTVTATEAVSVPADQAWLILFTDSSATNGDTLKSLSLESAGTTSWKFTLPKGTIKQGMWAQLNANSDVVDSKNNQPLAINRKVELLVEMGTVPSFTGGVIYDRYGENNRRDGYGDSGYVMVSLAEDSNRVTMQDLQNVVITTPSGTQSVLWTYVNDSTITFNDPSLNGVTGVTNVDLQYSAVTVSGNLTDSVAPAVFEAIYERWENGDTLEVTFTEPLSNSGTSEPFLFVSQSSLVLSESYKSGARVRYEVMGTGLGESDSLWIDPAGQVIDMNRVEQTWLDNRQVPVKLLQIVTPVDTWFKDTDERPDGIADELRLTTTMPIPASMYSDIVSNLTLPSHRGTVASVSGTGTELVFTLTPIDSAAALTSVSGETVSLTADVRNSDTLFHFDGALAVKDSMAPVATAAVYHFGETDNDTMVIDTLIVTFSERVEPKTTPKPFMLEGADGLYSLELLDDKTGGITVTYLREYRLNDTVPENGDLFWIDRFGDVKDGSGNVQNRDTKPVAIEVSEFQTNYELKLYPNPVGLRKDGTFDNEYLRDLGEEESRVVLAVAPVGLRPIPEDKAIDVRIALVDVVGNVIFEKTDMKGLEGNGRDLIFPFDLYNTNNRVIGRGSYVLVVELSGGVKAIRKMMLGVKEVQGDAGTPAE